MGYYTSVSSGSESMDGDGWTVRALVPAGNRMVATCWAQRLAGESTSLLIGKKQTGVFGMKNALGAGVIPTPTVITSPLQACKGD
jgi:hypothetical protein